MNSRRGLFAVLLSLAAVAAPAFAARRLDRGSSATGRTPSHSPPQMPTYRGRVAPLPHGTRWPGSRRSFQPRQTAPAPAPARRAESKQQAQPPARREDRRSQPVRDLSRNADLVHATIDNPAFLKSAPRAMDSRTDLDGKVHEYNGDGVRYAHWYDQKHDRHWFGFGQGKSYYWTVAYKGGYWWREPGAGRWLSYWRGHWWWYSATAGSYFVFIDGAYYQYAPTPNGIVLVPNSPPSAPGASADDKAPDGGSLVVSSMPEFFYSKDNSRLVQVEGSDLNAYLYDSSGGHPELIKFLGKGVTQVEYSDTAKGQPLQIVLSIQDESGHVARVTLDKDGNVVNGAAQVSAPPSPPSYGTPGPPGFDAPGGDLPPTQPPFQDGN